MFDSVHWCWYQLMLDTAANIPDYRGPNIRFRFFIFLKSARAIYSSKQRMNKKR